MTDSLWRKRQEPEALRLALEALEEVVKWYQVRDKNDDPLPVHNQNPEIKASIEAITAVQRALAQPEQEPVAWMSKDADIVYTSIQVDGCFQHDHIPLYTTPPQRTWVGLNDEAMEAVFIECGGKWNSDFWKIEDADFHPFLRTIEAKLKQKNMENT
jgi:hypothetical protein